MNIIILGPQGSGKGTQGKRLAKKLGVPHLSSGDLLRDIIEQGGEMGEKLKAIMDAGDLVDDDFLEEILEKRLAQDDCKNGFLLDGTPRDSYQTKMLEKIIKIDAAILISITDEEAVKRISGRRFCPVDHTWYNLMFEPPKNEGVCDKCGTKLEARSDDTPDAVRERLTIYHEKTEPVIQHYRELGVIIEVDGMQSIEDVETEVWEKLHANQP